MSSDGAEGETHHQEDLSVINLVFGGGTPKTALITALFVGSILTVINHGDILFTDMPPPVFKIILTYCVPYCVATWGAVTGKLSQQRARS